MDKLSLWVGLLLLTGCGGSASAETLAVPLWAAEACERLCRPSEMPPVVLPSERPQDGGWRCFCDPIPGC